MVRSIAAVLCGFIAYAVTATLFVQSSGSLPGTWSGTAFATLEIVYGAIIAGLGGAITARVAPRNPFVHALALSGLILLASAASSLLVQGTDTARWSFVGTLLIDAPAAALGGYLMQGRRTYAP